MTAPHEHADLDALADALAEGQPYPADLTGCPTCSAALAELETALGAVSTDLAQLPPVPPVPAALERSVVPAPTPGATTILPGDGKVADLGERRQPRWLLPAGGLAAAAVLVVGGGLLLTHGKTDTSTDAMTASRGSHVPTSSTGARYTKTNLATAVPGLLKAKPEALAGDATKAASGANSTAGSTGSTGQVAAPMAADPLQLLRSKDGLAACLAGLNGPGDTTPPLALDYASFAGQPALVVVLQSSRPSKLDVFVVGASCNQTEQDVLFYLHADRPAS